MLHHDGNQLGIHLTEDAPGLRAAPFSHSCHNLNRNSICQRTRASTSTASAGNWAGGAVVIRMVQSAQRKRAGLTERVQRVQGAVAQIRQLQGPRRHGG